MEQNEQQGKNQKSISLHVLDDLYKRSLEYRRGEKFLGLLKFINRFPNLSPYNAFLVQLQNSGVEIVAREKEWEVVYHRKVKPYSRPLVILVPFGPVAFVYDIADTEGLPVPEELSNPFAVHGRIDERLYLRLFKNIAEHNIRYEEHQMHVGVAGYAKTSSRQYNIVVNSKWSKEEKYGIIAHELGHIFSGHLGKRKNDWWEFRLKTNRYRTWYVHGQGLSLNQIHLSPTT